MLKKLFGVFVLMFLMAIALPVLAQRYDSCERRGRGNARGHYKQQRYDRDRDYGYRQDYGRRNNNRGAYYGGNNGYYNSGYYAPAYYPQTYYAPSYYVVRRPVRRIYNNYGYRPRYHSNRGRISFSIGF